MHAFEDSVITMNSYCFWVLIDIKWENVNSYMNGNEVL